MSESSTSKAIGVAVLTVSDSAAADHNLDKSGHVIQEIVKERGFQVRAYRIVPDDEEEIREAILSWADIGSIDCIITTGGTGFGVRDRTPEAVTSVLERQASGIVHLLLATSFKHTPLAALSRPVAGTVKNSFVVTLPGSVKAVRENIEALLSDGIINHAIDLVRGGKGKQVHTALAKSVSSAQDITSQDHSHDHHRHGHHDHKAPQPRTVLSHDPSLPVTGRHRVSPYALFSLNDALAAIMNVVNAMGPLQTETKPVSPSLRGYVLAEDIYAPQYVPSTHTTSVDGYALTSTDKPGIYKVLTSQTHDLSNILPEGSVYRINTGGPLPLGADTVIMVEDTRLHSTMKNDDGEDIEEDEVEILVQVPPSENVRAPGSDVRKGDLVLPREEIITSAGGEIGTFAFVGRKEVEVFKKPVVAVLSTGNEIVDLHLPNDNKASDGWGGIWDTNRPSLQAALEGMGYEVIDLGIVSDEVTAHVNAISEGLRKADVLLTTGGTSMGPSDLLKPVIERHFNGTIHFGRVAAKPGKPTTFASVPYGAATKLLFALPGNPASALVTFHIFVLPALRRMSGWPIERCHLPRVRVKLGDAMSLDPRTEFHRVVIRAGTNGLTAYSTGGQRSSRVASLSGANGLAVLPPKVKGDAHKLEVGDLVDAVVIGELQMM